MGLDPRTCLGAYMAFTEIEGGLDWQAAAFINEFFKGFNERLPEATPPSGSYADNEPLDLVEVGDDIQLASLWSVLQGRIENQFNYVSPVQNTATRIYGMRWLVPHDLAPVSGVFTSSPSVMDWAAFCDYTSEMHTSGWRRATTWNPAVDDWTAGEDTDMWDRAENGHGPMQAGDIIGPWIFADLQTALDNMRTRVLFTEPYGKGTQKTAGGYGTSYADLETAFLAASDTNVFADPEATHLKSSSLGYYSLYRNKVKYGLWDSSTVDDFSLVSATEFAAGANSTDVVDYYSKAASPTADVSVFDANGESLSQDEWSLVGSGTLSAASSFFGSTATAPVEHTGAFSPSGGTGFVCSQNFCFIQFVFEWVK